MPPPGMTAQLPPLVSGLSITRLPNGLPVQCVSQRDVPFLYKEIFERRCYMQHGISLPRGGTVVDVGANIGLFSLLAAQELGPEGLVVSCEPLPPTFKCLEHNVSAHQRWWQQQQQQGSGQQQGQTQQLGSPSSPAGTDGPGSSSSAASTAANTGLAPIVPLCVGVGSGASSSADFTLYPLVAGWSSMMPEDKVQIQADMGAVVDTALSSREAVTSAGFDGLAMARLGFWLRSVAPNWLYRGARKAYVAGLMGVKQHYTCPLTSVQQLVRQGLPALPTAAVVTEAAAAAPAGLDLRLASRGIDLLKVDVERAELEVLRGVGDCWPLVRQVAAEVHEENLEGVLQVLRSAGFSDIIVEQDSALAGSSLHAVYCRR